MTTPETMRMLPLSELEVGMIGAPPIDVLVHYSGQIDVDRVERGFRAALRQLDVFASRLAYLGGDEYALISDPAGATFTRRAPVPASATEFELGGHGKVMERVRGLPGDPLMAASYTPLPNGALLGLSVSHVVGDGVSVLRFFAHWVAQVQGMALPPPASGRSYRLGSLAAPHDVFSPRGLPEAVTSRLALYASLRRESYSYHLSQGAVDASVQATPGVTRHHLVVAHLLKEHALKMVPVLPQIRLRLPVDVRGLHPQVPDDYVGNAFIDALATFSRSDLEARSVAELAGPIAEAIAHVRDPATLEERLSWTPSGLAQRAPRGEPIAPGSDVVCSNLVKLGDILHVASAFGNGSADAAEIMFIAPAGFILTRDKGRIAIRVVYPARDARGGVA